MTATGEGSHIDTLHTSERRAAAGAWSSNCRDCGAPLALDQRYCVECGARRGALPAAISQLIAAGVGGAALAGGTSGAATKVAPDTNADALQGESQEPRRGWAGGLAALTPRTIAVAVMATLGFGVIVGTAVSPAEETTSGPVLLAAAPPKAPSTPTSSTPAAETPSQSTEPEPSSPASSEPAESAASEPSTPSPSSTPAAATQSPSKGSEPKSGSGAPAPTTTALPPIKHVFVIVLSGQGYEATFGAESKAPYLSKTLPKQGELLRDYYAVTGGELANMVALISGQGPTVQTASNCPVYASLTPATAGSDGQVLGTGCVYPQRTLTIADQLTSAGKTWKAYVGGMEDGAPGQPKTCRHPELGGADPSQAPTPGDPYVTWRNPFVYFQSLTAGTACSLNDVGLERLAFDLTSAATTPSLAFIVPDRCHDGSEEPCAPGQPAGLGPADQFLETVVPEIERSKAYAEGGLIAITSDEAPQSGPHADSSGCCLTSAYPNLPATSTLSTTTTTTPGPATSTTSTALTASTVSTSSTLTTTTTTSLSASATTTTSSSTTSSSTTTAPASTSEPPGGGKVGLLLISKYVKPGTVNAIGEYNHFSLLASIEKLFGLKPLGYAASPGILAFDKSVFNAYR